MILEADALENGCSDQVSVIKEGLVLGKQVAPFIQQESEYQSHLPEISFFASFIMFERKFILLVSS
jgi:hypothetical protein